MLDEEFSVGKSVIRLVRGDITEMATDAVVNAANSTLMGGGGVDGAIHRKGGSQILQECRIIRENVWPDGLPTGKAVITSGGNLKAKNVIHAVGPIWNGGRRGESELLRQVYLSALQLAFEKGLRTVAFPSISTGAYGYPIESACRIALKTVREFLQSKDELRECVFVLFSDHDFRVYSEAAKEVFRK
jgi:O-acetyl-ADP-ribose deacetylase (regulator of RNase III)